jgi:hypothetical protein
MHRHLHGHNPDHSASHKPHHDQQDGEAKKNARAPHLHGITHLGMETFTRFAASGCPSVLGSREEDRNN